VKNVKWPIKRLLFRGQQRLLRVWLRYVESLRGEEEVVNIYELEVVKILSDEEKRSEQGLISFQVGNEERRLSDSPMNSVESSYQQGELMEE
jgi:hypothetical protein